MEEIGVKYKNHIPLPSNFHNELTLTHYILHNITYSTPMLRLVYNVV